MKAKHVESVDFQIKLDLRVKQNNFTVNEDLKSRSFHHTNKHNLKKYIQGLRIEGSLLQKAKMDDSIHAEDDVLGDPVPTEQDIGDGQSTQAIYASGALPKLSLIGRDLSIRY